MAGLISDIVGGNVDSDLDKLVAKLATVEKELDVINGKAISIKVDLQGVGTLSELTNLYKQQDDILTKLRSTSVQYVDTYKMATEVIKQHNGHSKEFVAVSQGIAKTTLEEARARKENAKALLDEQKYIAQLAKEKERIDKLAAKEVENLNKQKGAYSQLNEEYKKAAKAAQDLGAQQELLNRQLSATTNTSQRETVVKQMQDLSPALKAAQQNAMSLHTSMLAVDMAVGKAQRNVGNYNSAQFAMSQLLREAPSFAYSFSTGLLSLSNNIPILVDEITKLKAANEALKASGAATIPIWKTLLAAFTSPVGLITIATAAVTIFAARMSMAGNETKKATDALHEYEEQLKTLDKTQKSLRASTEAAVSMGRQEIETLVAQLLHSKSIEAKTEAYNKLKAAIPGVLRGYTEEQVLAGKANDAIYKHTEQIVRLKGELKELQPLYEMQVKIFEKTRDKVTELKAKLGDRWQEGDNTTAANFKKQLSDMVDTGILIDEKKRQLAEFESPDLPKEKKAKKEKKDTISDDLAAAKSDYELQLMLNQQKFANSRKTYFEEQQLNADNLKATMEYGERYTMIVEDFNNKHLLTENEHIKHINDANKILLEGQIKAKEAGDKIEEEILKKKIQTNNEMLKYIESLSKQRQELEKINREIDNIQDKAASRKEYAESFAPYLEGFGFNTAFGQQVKQKNADISARKTELGVLEGNKPNEASDPKTYGMRLLQWETNVAKEKENIAKMEADRDEMYNQKMIEGKKELARKTVELAKTAFDALNTIRNNAFAAEQKQLEIQSQNLKIRTDQQMRAIDAKAGFEVSKANERTKLAAETAAKENEIRSKYNQLALRQAIANKQAAQAEVISQTAVAIISTMASYAKLGPAGIALGIGLSAAIAGIGAAQYAAVSSAPLPQYAKGTEGTTAERFIAGEKGAELGVTPSGKTMLFEKEGIYSAPLGTKIKTADQTKKLMQYAINGIGYNGESLNALSQNMHISLDDKKIVDSIKEQTHDIAVTLWKTKGNNNSSTQQAYIDAVREQQNLISKFK